jgi:radical SAM protein with 4Fe4S-binding SPASM domain
VRLGDLAICPCHRTAYEKYLYGHFIVENDIITGIRANNTQMAIKVLMSNMKTAMHGCDTCIFKNTCLKGCFGAQLESTGDPFFPCPSVCKLFKRKYSALIEYYASKGLFEYLKTFLPEQEGAQEALALLQLYKKWEAEKDGMGKCE